MSFVPLLPLFMGAKIYSTTFYPLLCSSFIFIQPTINAQQSQQQHDQANWNNCNHCFMDQQQHHGSEATSKKSSGKKKFT
jgi:hypothetical protein